MGTKSADGFTIIETMLFLAVSGVLIVGMIAGTGASLNIQRYRDSVETFKSLLQSQYSDLGSVQNGRSNSLTCDASAQPTGDETSAGAVPRGQTNCLLVGKYMTINRGAITIYSVLAYQTSTTPQSDDITALRSNYTLNVSTLDVDHRTMEWGTEIGWPSAGPNAQSPQTPRTIGLLFVRSPDSGQIYTFSNDAAPQQSDIAPSTLADMLVAGNVIPGQSARTLCVISGGLLVPGDMALYIGPFASGTSAVEVRSNDYMAKIGVSTRC